MGKRLKEADMRRLRRACGVEDASGEVARSVRKFLEDSSVLAPLGHDRYALGPMVRFRDGDDPPTTEADEPAGTPTRR